MRISDCSSDVCSSDLRAAARKHGDRRGDGHRGFRHPRVPNHSTILAPRRFRYRESCGFPHDSNIVARQSCGECRRSEEHTSELQSLMRISYAVFCLKKKNNTKNTATSIIQYQKHNTLLNTHTMT